MFSIFNIYRLIRVLLHPKAVLLLEAVGLFQLIGLGVGDWKALG